MVLSNVYPPFWGIPRKQGLRSNSALFWAPKNFAPFARRPTCGPLLILPPALKRWGPPRRRGLCSHLAHLWASDSAPRSEAVGTPGAAWVM